MRILLIGGGWSNEREISLRAIPDISEAMQGLGHEVVFLDPAIEFDQLLPKASICDFAFINLHGTPGEDGLVQALLTSVGCPYQGGKADSSMLAFNKSMSKVIFVANNIKTPGWEFLALPPKKDWQPSFPFPLIIKPNTGGSSLDVSLVFSNSELLEQIDKIFSSGNTVILEEYVQGQDITCAVLGQEALSPILILPPEESTFFDFFSKYTPAASQEICPAPVSPELKDKIEEIAIQAHMALNLADYSRTDFIINDNQPYALEVNSLPGLTTASLFPKAAKERGYSFQDLIKQLIELGLQSKGD